MWELTFPYLETFLMSVLAVATPLAAKYAIGWLKGLSHSATFNCALEKAEKMTEIGVSVASQTYADERKRRAEDGKLTPEEAKEAFEIAAHAAYASLGSKWFAEMQSCAGMAEQEAKLFLGRMIEARVHQNKTGS